MKKLEEILDIFPAQNFNRERVKEIAIAYAKLCLEKAAEEVTIDCYIKSSLRNARWKKIEDNVEFDVLNNKQMYKVNKESITNIELP